MALPDYVEYWLNKSKKLVTAEIIPSDNNYRAWIGIYPILSDRRSLNYSKDVNYRVHYFEIKKQILIDAEKENRYIEPEDLHNSQEFLVRNEDDLEQILKKWIRNLETLVQPHASNYPL